MLTIDQLNANPLPFARLMGLRLVSVSKDEVVAELKVRDDLCTAPMQILHGGAAMALADTVGGVATFLNLPEGATGTTTIESKTNFLAAAEVGTTVRAITTPVHRGAKTQVWQTRITREDGKLLALVTQTQMVL
ncbi:MAG: PaaI family thioesterase [Micropepsaceae bacterium]